MDLPVQEIRLERRLSSYWRVTFDIPPVNIFGPKELPQLNEIITAIEIGAPAPRSAYLKIRERESYEYATVSAAVALELDGDVIRHARIALGSVAMRPWRLEVTERRLVGQRLGSSAVEGAVDAGFEEARPLSSNAYKIRLARNAALRTIELAARTS